MFDWCVSDMMGVGICGVDGAGKGKLALAYAEDSGLDLLIWNREILLSQTRTKIKTKAIIMAYKDVLSMLESKYMEASERFITDMTPIDIMAEMYSLFSWYSMPKSEEDKIVNEVWEYSCFLCTRYLSVIMHIQPVHCSARQEQLNSLTVGLIYTRLINEAESDLFTVSSSMIDTDARLEALKHFVYGKCVAKTPYANVSSLKH